MSDEATPGPPPKDGSVFRAIIGFIALGAGIVGFLALYFVPIPPGNRDALMLALGIVIGWGSSVIQSEYGASTTGRKVADHAIKQLEERKP